MHYGQLENSQLHLRLVLHLALLLHLAVIQTLIELNKIFSTFSPGFTNLLRKRVLILVEAWHLCNRP